MKLYFGNMVTTVTTLMIVSLVGFVGYSISNRSNINFWGRRSLFVLAYGLVICCFAAARDGLDKTIQYTIDGSCKPGIFSLVSVPNIVGCIGAAIIMIAAIATPIAKSQKESDPEMKQAYTEMLEGCLSNPDKRIWYAIWNMELKDDPETIVSQKVLFRSGFVSNGKVGEEGPRFVYEGR